MTMLDRVVADSCPQFAITPVEIETVHRLAKDKDTRRSG